MSLKGSEKENFGRLWRVACMCAHTHTLEMELLGAVSLYKSEEGVGGEKEGACHPHKVYVCEHRSKNCWGAFLIHSGLRTRSLLSKLSSLLIYPPTSPFHLNSLFIRSHSPPLPQNKTNPKSHLS